MPIVGLGHTGLWVTRMFHHRFKAEGVPVHYQPVIWRRPNSTAG
jgi:hypothetical protein